MRTVNIAGEDYWGRVNQLEIDVDDGTEVSVEMDLRDDDETVYDMTGEVENRFVTLIADEIIAAGDYDITITVFDSEIDYNDEEPADIVNYPREEHEGDLLHP